MDGCGVTAVVFGGSPALERIRHFFFTPTECDPSFEGGEDTGFPSICFFFNLPGMWVCVSRSQEDLPSGLSNVTMVLPSNVSLFIAEVHYPGLWWVYAFSAELRGWSLFDERRNFGLSISRGTCLFVFFVITCLCSFTHSAHTTSVHQLTSCIQN